jgi:hypothetical protein
LAEVFPKRVTARLHNEAKNGNVEKKIQMYTKEELEKHVTSDRIVRITPFSVFFEFLQEY